jgi:hypothetical protein
MDKGLLSQNEICVLHTVLVTTYLNKHITYTPTTFGKLCVTKILRTKRSLHSGTFVIAHIDLYVLYTDVCLLACIAVSSGFVIYEYI